MHYTSSPARHRPAARPARFDAGRELDRLAVAQRRMLAQTAPQVAAYELALAYRPAYVATGDYHDFIHRADGRTAVFVGDGSGHGPTASLLTATLRTILRTHPELHTDPGPSLTAAGRMFSALNPPDLFMTGVYLLLGEAGRVSWASAGHDPPLCVSRSGRLAPVDLSAVGLPLGTDPDERYRTVSWVLDCGERLVLFTDGLVEARGEGDDLFGRPRLRAAVTELAHLPLADMVRALVARVAAFVQAAEFEDDFTVVAVERRA